MVRVKLVTIDVDGTLLNSARLVTNKVKLAIQEAKEKGVKIVITTGRPYLGVVELLKELGLTDKGDYVITYNGAMILAADSGIELARKGLTYPDYLRIKALADSLDISHHAVTANRLFTDNCDVSPYSVEESFIAKVPMSFRSSDEMRQEDEIIKMMLVGESQALQAAIEKITPEFKRDYTTVSSSPNFFEVLNKSASKGQGLVALSTILEIPITETMAIGDAENDLSMLEAAGISVAMGNATEVVKSIADFQTTSNDEDGVAVALKRYIE